MRNKIKSFQELRHTFFLISLWVGGYPPGATEYLKSKPLQWFFYWIGLTPYLGCIAYCSGLSYHIIFSTPEDPVFLIKLIRRDIIIAFLAIRLGNHLLRYKKTDHIFRRWNEDMNTTYMAEERKVKVEEYLLSTAKIAGFGLFVRTLMAELYNVPFMMNRYVLSSELAGFPHDNSSSSHFYYVAYQVILFVWIGAAVPPIEMYVVYISALAHTEMDLLKDKLASIMGTLDVNVEEGLIYNSPKGPVPIEFNSKQYDEIVKHVDKDLGRWTKQHIDTLDWISEICDYLTLDTTCKYVYLAVHCSLVVIGLTGMNGSSMVNDLALTLMVTLGNFWVLFYGTRKIDSLKKKTNQVALEAYAKGWFLYPPKIQKKYHLITGGAVLSSVTVPVFTIYEDNSENMKAVLQMAYQALTVILPMTAGD